MVPSLKHLPANTIRKTTSVAYERVRAALQWAALGFFPPRCMACEAPTDAPHRFCDGCFGALAFIAAPQCECCGLPFEMALGEQALCGACLQARPPYGRARAALHYDDTVRPMIARFKYRDRTHHAAAYGQLMWRAGASLLTPDTLIIPVPLHLRRLLQRRFNQSALLAEGVARMQRHRVLPDGLLRVRHTPPQASLSRKERLENVRGAFRVNHAHAALIRGAQVVLIDDVMTTGATIHACVQALQQAGAARVDVLTLARTIRGE